ncbi:hypothetical protein [Pseudooctadecabacter jejudonensis]|uniref:GCN5-related N-acetyltransferase n=1 Tax=Pseudooctadecabacter jejudonensis TaxID=1391910 RepID=A0A1Y5SWS9_9RHOB|nr:hypothetical protein [Pseudooctadecabacter jejudonensis]SLN50295.1 hypothetical protein PSJ8397_02622 [Pseudooctadecabacter jejudonensis]
MTDKASRVDRYLTLTRQTLPDSARSRDWPVVNDHCFQRIILDHISGGVWYDHINRPAYKNMTDAQLAQAIKLAEDILHGRAYLHAMNRQSLKWRGKLRQ